MRNIVMIALIAAVSIAGCVGDESPDDNLAVVPELTSYLDRQTAAHPAFGFPTSTNYDGLAGAVPDAWMPPEPVEVPDVITGIEHVSTATDVAAGAGLAIFGHYAIVSGNGPGSIVDIADPMNPVKVADLEVSVRDADIIAYPDGRLVAVLASNGPIHIFDVTNPERPIQLPSLEISSHNAVVVPGTPIVYNSGSAGGAGGTVPSNPQAWVGDGVGVTEIFDLSDPNNPVQLETFENGYGCHDITTYIDAVEQKYRAYCAGIEMTQIWDISDPRAPEVLVNIPVHHGLAGTPSGSVPLVLFSHLAMVNSDASVLIVGDETFGGIGPGCSGTADTGVASSSGPTGNLWFYDITDEANPVLQGWISPNDSYLVENPPAGDPGAGYAFQTSCTAHFGRLIEDRDVLAIGFYRAGVLLVDFSTPTAPEIIAQFNEGTNVWDVWFWQGYLFTGDLSKGLDVLKLV